MFFFQADLRSKTTRLHDIHGIIVIRFKWANNFPGSNLFFFLPPVKQFPWLTATPFREEEDERAMAVVGEHEMLLKEWFFFFNFSLKSKVLLFLVHHTKQTLNFFQN